MGWARVHDDVEGVSYPQRCVRRRWSCPCIVAAHLTRAGVRHDVAASRTQSYTVSRAPCRSNWPASSTRSAGWPSPRTAATQPPPGAPVCAATRHLSLQTLRAAPTSALTAARPHARRRPAQRRMVRVFLSRRRVYVECASGQPLIGPSESGTPRGRLNHSRDAGARAQTVTASLVAQFGSLAGTRARM